MDFKGEALRKHATIKSQKPAVLVSEGLKRSFVSLPIVLAIMKQYVHT